LSDEQRACCNGAGRNHRAERQILALPRANIHADLFRDNAMFEGTHLTGLIDFYNACSGPMLYDVAIALNDWCSDEEGLIDGPRARALLGAYAACGRSLLPKPSCGRPCCAWRACASGCRA
jgi:homoserine kinase type II